MNNLLSKSVESKKSLASSIDRLTNEISNAKDEIESIKLIIDDGQAEHDEFIGEKNIIAEQLTEIENKLKLLRPETLNRDMLDERVRDILGLSHPDEIIFRIEKKETGEDVK